MSHPLTFKCIGDASLSTLKCLRNVKTEMSFEPSHFSKWPDLGLKRDFSTNLSISYRISSKPSSKQGDYIINDKQKVVRNDFHSTVLHHTTNEKLGLAEQAKQMKNSRKKRQEKHKRVMIWKRLWLGAISILIVKLILGTNILLWWCYYNQEKREALSRENPKLKMFLDAILGPANNDNDEENSEVNVKSRIDN